MGGSTDIESLLSEALAALEACSSQHDLNMLKSKYTGKTSPLNQVLRSLREVAPERRGEISQAANHAKKTLLEAVHQRSAELKAAQVAERLRTETIDVTLPGRMTTPGASHPLADTMQQIADIFGHMGFEPVDGPEIEDDYHNFTALNIPPFHPARAMHDTFYLDADYLLRTHTSPVQIRALQRFNKPISVISIGRTYRCDSDQTHSPMFHQVEGLAVGENINMGMLKACLHRFLSEFFGREFQMRLRPSYFPFTEPSAEVDIRFSDDQDWLEVLGCGMVHPNVLKEAGVDTDTHRGFAFGCGVERLTMLKQNVNDLRAFFVNETSFLQQFDTEG